MTSGYAYGAGYVVTIALTSIWLSDLGNTWPVFELLFLVMAIAGAFFLLYDLKNLRKNHAVIVERFPVWLAMSVCVLGMWTCTYFSTMNGPAAFFLAVYFLAAGAWVETTQRKFLNAAVCVLAALFCYHAIEAATPITFASSAAAGFFGVGYSHYSKKLADECSLSVSGVLSIRFYLLILFSGALYLYLPETQVPQTHRDGWLIVFLLAGSHVIVPNSLSQAALHKLGVERLFVMMTLLPPVVAVMEGLIFGTWNLEMLGATALASLALNLSPLRRRIGLILKPEAPTLPG